MNTIQVIAKKELKDMFRDRRVLFGALVLPILVNLMVTQMFATIGSSLSSKKTAIAYYVEGQKNDKIVTLINQTKAVQLKPARDLESGKKLLESGTAKLLLDWTHQSPSNSQQIIIKSYFTSDETQSSIALARFESAISQTNTAITHEALKSAGLPPEVAQPFKVESTDTAKSKGAGESILVSMLPYLLIVFVFAGGMSVASDLVAGEKERNTLETLLTNPIKRSHIAIGKWIAVVTFALTAAITSVSSLLISGATSETAKKMMFPAGLGLSVPVFANVLLVATTLALMLGSLQLLISANAKNMREAQTYLAAANFVVLLPAVFSQIIGMTDAASSAWVRWVPVLNSAMAVRDTLLAKVSPLALFAPVSMNLIMAAIFLLLTIQVMSNERVLAKS